MHPVLLHPLISETHACSFTQFEEVKKNIRAFELDSRELKQNEFLVESNESGLLGFGRIRKFKGFSELCSLGIVENERSKGYGKKLTLALIEKETQPLYLVCIIPEFFETLGFRICNNYPAEIKEKLHYCNNSLPVEESYIVMKLDQRIFSY